MSTGVRPQPLLAVRDVRRSSRWYAALLDGQRTSELVASDHAHLYDRILSDGQLVLQLHAWDVEDHPSLVKALDAEVVEEPHENPAPGHREMWLRDPDGYLVVICSPDGEI